MERREPVVREGLGPMTDVLGPNPAGIVRRLSTRRVARAAALAGAILVALAATAWGWGRVRNWLAHRPEYRGAFAAIRLEPTPPTWFRPGSAGLLDDVRRKSGFPETLDVLALDLEALGRAFRHHAPWVREVRRIDRAYPNRLVVALDYREPVAEVSGPGFPTILIDDEAVVLAREDVDLERLGPPPIRIVTAGAPATLKPGSSWQIRGEAGLTVPDPSMIEAARMAGFLRSKTVTPATSPALPKLRSVQTDPSGLYLLDTPILREADREGSRWIRWRGPIDPSRPDRLDDEAKWGILVEWLEANPWPPLPKFLDFDRDRIVVRVFKRDGSRRPSGESAVEPSR